MHETSIVVTIAVVVLAAIAGFASGAWLVMNQWLKTEREELARVQIHIVTEEEQRDL